MLFLGNFISVFLNIGYLFGSDDYSEYDYWYFSKCGLLFAEKLNFLLRVQTFANPGFIWEGTSILS